MKILESTELFFRKGSSDKFFFLKLEEEVSFFVTFSHGRVGSKPRVNKHIFIDLPSALAFLQKKKESKLNKGYVDKRFISFIQRIRNLT